MPEGDTVWRTGQTLDRALSGTHVRVDLRVPDLATYDLSGTVLTTATRGKHLLTRFDSGATLHTHLKMEGSWHLYRPGERWRRPTHEARVVLVGDAWTAVGFALGVVEVVATVDEDSVVGHLGPDLLGVDWAAEQAAAAVRRLLHEPARPLGEALLDQRNLAGIGNMYAAELCFLFGRHPSAPVADVPDLPRLVDRAHRLLLANSGRPEQTTTGDLRRDRRLWVYRRERQACRRCGTRVVLGEHGPLGRRRAAYWCPGCQPDPGGTDAGRRPG